jgi:hypothetical protein
MNKLILTSIFIIALAGIVSSAQYGMMGDNGQFTPMQNQNYGMGGMMGMMQMMSGSGYAGYYNSGTILLSWITYLLFIALILSAVYWLIKSANRKK